MSVEAEVDNSAMEVEQNILEEVPDELFDLLNTLGEENQTTKADTPTLQLILSNPRVDDGAVKIKEQAIYRYSDIYTFIRKI